MKNSKPLNLKARAGALILAGLFAGLPGTLRAASTPIYKANTTTLSAATDWTTTSGGATTVAAAVGKLGVFDSSLSLGNAAALTLGGNVALDGLQFAGTLNGPVTIGAGNTLTLGTVSGIDMSAANQSATLNCNVALGASQNWSVNSGQTLTVGGVVSGASTVNLTKVGSGTIVLSGNNTFTGGIVLPNAATAAGWLQVASSTALGPDATSKTISLSSSTGTATGGIQLIGGVTVNNKAITVGGRSFTTQFFLENVSGNNAWNGSLTINNSGGSYYVQSDADTLTLGGILQNSVAGGSRAFEMVGPGNGVISGNVTNGSGTALTGIYMQGTGTWILTGANTYTGGTTVNHGKLIVTTATTSTMPYVITNSATLGVAVSAPNTTLNASALTLGTTAATALEFEGVNSTTTAVLTVGALTNISPVTINVTSGNFVAGQNYPLIGYTTLTGSGTFTLGTLPSGVTATLNTSASPITLQVSAVTPLVWNGNLSAIWDIGTTANWKNGSGPGQTYSDNSLVQFDDTLTAHPAITLTTTVSPGNITFANNNTNYSLTGTGGISGGGGLTQSGSATTIIDNSGVNIYTGPTTISAGTLQFGNNDVNGNLPAGSSITDNGTLAYNRTDNFTVANAISGSGSLVQNGTGTLTLSGAPALTGKVAVNSGVLAFNGGFTGIASGTVASGASLQFLAPATTLNVFPLTLNGNGSANTLSFPTGDAKTFNMGGIALSGDIIIYGYGLIKIFNFNSPITSSGANSLTFEPNGNNSASNPHTYTLNAASTYSGNTTFWAQSQQSYLKLGVANALPTTTSLTLIGGTSASTFATLDLNGHNQTLAGLMTTPNAGGANATNSSTTSVTLTVSNNSPNTVAGILGGSVNNGFSLTKLGSSTLTLSAVNTYTGGTTIGGGELLGVVGGSCASSAVTVAATAGNLASLGVSVANNTKQWTCPSVTINNGGISSGLDFNFGTLLPSTTLAPLNVTGAATFTTTPTVTVELVAANITVGAVYPLMTWGSTSGTAPTSVAVTTPGHSPVTGHLTVTGGNTLNLVIDTSTSTEPLSWAGSNGTWDLNDSGNLIWKDNTSASTYFQTGDSVVFDNTVGSGGTVTLNTVLSPVSVLVNNPTVAYTISGTGGIAGSGSLTKSGAAALTLATTNTFTGGTIINGGTLILNSSTGPALASAATINTGGTLQLGSGTNEIAAGVTVTMAGGTFNMAGATNSFTALNGYGTVADNVGGGALSLTGANTVSGGTLNLQSGTLNITNTGVSALVINNASTLLHTGGTVADAGYVQVAGQLTISGGSFGCGLELMPGYVSTGSVTVNGGTLDSYVLRAGTAATGTFNLNTGGTILTDQIYGNGSVGLFYFNGGTLGISTRNSARTPGNWIYSLTHAYVSTNGALINTANNGGHVYTNSQPLETDPALGVAADGGLTKLGAGTLTLSGTNTYTGNTTISAGTLALSGSGSIVNTPSISIATNTTFNVSAVTPANYTNGSGRTLAFNIDKTGSTLSQGQLVLGSKNLTYGGSLTVAASGSGTLASGDSFNLITNTGTFSGWCSNVTVPALATGLSWDTNHLATAGVLDVYTFTTTALTVSTLTNTVTTISAAKLANHVSSAKLITAYPATGWTATVTSTPSLGSASFDGSGNLVYTANGTAGTDNFTVTFNDGHGSQAMAVTVTVSEANVGPSITPVVNGSGYGTFTASGLPGTNYVVQITTSLNSPVTWIDYSTNAALGNGLIDFIDSVSVSGHGGTVYYRLKQQ